MPTYEYKCKKCQREFEIEQRITEEPLTKCIYEDCDGEVFRKISKNIGLVFNGSGFYLTDYVHKKDNPPTHSSSDKHTATTPTNGNLTIKNNTVTPENGTAAPKNGVTTPKKEAVAN